MPEAEFKTALEALAADYEADDQTRMARAFDAIADVGLSFAEALAFSDELRRAAYEHA